MNHDDCIMIHGNDTSEINEWELREWISHPDMVYVGDKHRCGTYPERDSKWSNPFKDCSVGDRREKYKTYIREKVMEGKLNLKELEGKLLICLCDQTVCHARILGELLYESNVSFDTTLEEQSDCMGCGSLMYFHCKECQETFCYSCLTDSGWHDGFTCLIPRKTEIKKGRKS